jgi:hypothetical protein
VTPADVAERTIRFELVAALGLFVAGAAAGLAILQPFVCLGFAAAAVVLLAFMWRGLCGLAEVVGHLEGELDTEKRERARDAGGWLAGQHIEDRRS